MILCNQKEVQTKTERHSSTEDNECSIPQDQEISYLY